MKHPILVNRQRCIKTLSDKAEITGFRFVRPSTLPDGAEPFAVIDVNGKTHDTIIKRNTNKKDEIGVYDENLAGIYHGRLSRHWKPETHTADGIIKILNAGYSVAPGLYDNPPDKSHRSGNYRAWTDVVLFDGDEWSDAHPAPESIDALIKKYPTLPDHFYWVAESISSRSSLKPYLNLRLMMVLPEPINRDDPWTWNALVEWVTDLYPFVAAGVAADKVRLSFGNARPDRSEHRFDKVLDIETLNTFRQNGAAALAKNVFAEIEKTKQSVNQTQRREKSERVTAELKAKGVEIPDTKDPLVAFNETDIESLLRGIGCSHLKGTEWHWYESGQGKSFNLFTDNIPTIHPFSGSLTKINPNQGNTIKAVGAHRILAIHLYGLDMSKDSDKPELRKRLAADGYGTSPEEYQRIQELKRNTAIEHGLVLPQYSHKKAKLKRSDTPTEIPTETLKENSESHESASDRFLTTEPPKDLIQIQLVNIDTGGGKTYTEIKKAYDQGKRTLVQTGHNELAEQAVDIALQVGFKNPLHLKGREHNWDASGIKDIPFSERKTKLFEKNNCIMVERTKEYYKRNLAPMTFCMLFCPFREDDQGNIICKHLQQYIGLADRDFIATSNPNLFFDPSLHPYLQTLVNAKNETTDEDLAIDAMLGTSSEEKQPFDLGIIDDYQLNTLYPEKKFTQSRFKALKEAWNGTETGEFATLMLKAFEQKEPQDILEAFQKAFENTAEHHTEIEKHLTQHARKGVVQHTNRSIGSQETKKLLAEKWVVYTDGGKQFIPVNINAFLELKEKELPVIHPETLASDADIGQEVIIPHTPQAALQANVSLKDLTPVWQKGVTPINLLSMFLSQIGNPENAPVKREFTKSKKEPNAVLKFSIPPQLPVGILTHIAMLSATVDPAETRKAFDGQPAVFSDFVGGTIKYAEGVETYQYQDARLTSGSVFEYPNDSEGKRLLQEKPTGLKASAEKRLTKLNDWAKATDGLTAFITYKDFVTNKALHKHVTGFDIVTHFDKVTGLNFDGLKYLVVFGHPKVNHEDVMEHGRKQYASDSEALPKADPTQVGDKGKMIAEYTQLTEEVTLSENGYEITERRYKDQRLEKIRHQLSTEKLKQATGRARLIRWEDTITILVTNTPVKGFTERATLFSDATLKLSETPSEIPAAMERIQEAEETGDVKAIMETKDVSRRTAERDTQPARKERDREREQEILTLHQDGLSTRAISAKLKTKGYTKGTSKDSVARVIKECLKNDNAYKYIYIGDVANETPPTNPDVTSVSPVLPEKEVAAADKPVPKQKTSDPKPIPLSESFIDVMQIGIFFYGKHQLTPSEISQWTGHDETHIRKLLHSLYQVVCLSAGIGESYWMSERDRKKFESEILAPLKAKWIAQPGHVFTCEPVPDNIRNRHNHSASQ